MPDQLPVGAASPPTPLPGEPAEEDLPVSIHPLCAATAIAGWAWTLLVLWIVFFIKESPTALVNLVLVTGVSALLVAFITGLGWYTRGVASRGGQRFARPPRDFRDFLNSEVEIGTGRIKGLECYELAVGMGVTCAILGTGLGIGIGIA